jgi:hypothetical protein
MADPRRRMYGAPFGALQSAGSPIQFGDAGSAGPPAPSGVNALASSPPQPIAAPFGALQTPSIQYDNPSGPAPDPINTLSAPASAPPQFAIAPTGDPATTPQGPLTWPPPENTEDDPTAVARWLGLPDTRIHVPSVWDYASQGPTASQSQDSIPTDSIKALMQSVRRRY